VTEICPVTKDNWQELIRLKVREDQKHFVASNLYPSRKRNLVTMKPMAVIGTSILLEFTLMVDEKYQGKGYGRFGMNWMLERFRNDDRIRDVGISYEPDNEVGRKLYASLGFVETGEMVGDEVLAVLHLK
jgi:diamine N-acetyltransferase